MAHYNLASSKQGNTAVFLAHRHKLYLMKFIAQSCFKCYTSPLKNLSI